MTQQCKRCFEFFLTQKSLLEHLQKQEPCITKNVDLTTQLKLINNKYLAAKKTFKRKEETTFGLLCGFCNKTLSSSTNLTRHLDKNCKSKKDLEINISNYNNQKKQIQKQIKEVINKKKVHTKEIKEGKINETKSIINNTYNTSNNTSNNTNNIVNNINIFKLNSFGNETLDHIQTDEYKGFVKKDIGGFKTFLKRLHYSKEAPENHNVFIPDITRNHARVFIDDEWIYMDKNLVADSMKDNNLKLLEKILIKLNKELIIDNKSLNRFYTTRERINDDKYEESVIKDLLYMMSTAKLSANTANTLQINSQNIPQNNL
jgi:hypothetical protein